MPFDKNAQDFGLPPLEEDEKASIPARKAPAKPASFNLPDLPEENEAPSKSKTAPPSSNPFGLPDLIEDEEASTEEHHQRTAPIGYRPSNYSSSSGAIKAMQNAILQFAQTASASDATSMKGNQLGQEKGRSGEYLGGSDPFGDFLAAHIKGAKGNAVQYVNTDIAPDDRARMSIEDTGLRGIIDTIKRIGTPGAETAADGVWGQRINNALLQISKLMQSIANLSQSMNLPIKGLDKTVSAFSDAVPQNYTSISDKATLAEKLSKLISDLSAFFGQFKKSVLENSDLRQYIDQKKPFVSYQQKAVNGRDLLSNQEKAVFIGNKMIPNLMLNKQPVSLNDLDNMQSFSDLMTRIGRNPNDANQLKETLAEITNKLNAGRIGA